MSENSITLYTFDCPDIRSDWLTLDWYIIDCNLCEKHASVLINATVINSVIKEMFLR